MSDSDDYIEIPIIRSDLYRSYADAIDRLVEDLPKHEQPETPEDDADTIPTGAFTPPSWLQDIVTVQLKTYGYAGLWAPPRDYPEPTPQERRRIQRHERIQRIRARAASPIQRLADLVRGYEQPCNCEDY